MDIIIAALAISSWSWLMSDYCFNTTKKSAGWSVCFWGITIGMMVIYMLVQ